MLGVCEATQMHTWLLISVTKEQLSSSDLHVLLQDVEFEFSSFKFYRYCKKKWRRIRANFDAVATVMIAHCHSSKQVGILSTDEDDANENGT